MNELIDRLMAIHESRDEQDVQRIAQTMARGLAPALDMLDKADDAPAVAEAVAADILPIIRRLQRELYGEFYTGAQLGAIIAFFEANPWYLELQSIMTVAIEDRCRGDMEEIMRRHLAKYAEDEDEKFAFDGKLPPETGEFTRAKMGEPDKMPRTLAEIGRDYAELAETVIGPTEATALLKEGVPPKNRPMNYQGILAATSPEQLADMMDASERQMRTEAGCRWAEKSVAVKNGTCTCDLTGPNNNGKTHCTTAELERLGVKVVAAPTGE